MFLSHQADSQGSYPFNSDSKTSALFYILSLNPLHAGPTTFSEPYELAFLTLLTSSTIYVQGSLCSNHTGLLSVPWRYPRTFALPSAYSMSPQISLCLPFSHHSGPILMWPLQRVFPQPFQRKSFFLSSTFNQRSLSFPLFYIFITFSLSKITMVIYSDALFPLLSIY